MSSIDTPPVSEEAEDPNAKLAELLALRQAMKQRMDDAAAINTAVASGMAADDLLCGSMGGAVRYRSMRAFWSAALDKPPADVDETLLGVSWEQARRTCPNADAYARGIRALILQLAEDRPGVVANAILQIIGGDDALTLCEIAAVKAFDSDNAAATSSLHTGTEARH